MADAKGQVTTYGYDDAGRLIGSTKPNGLGTYTGYDANGNKIVEAKDIEIHLTI